MNPINMTPDEAFTLLIRVLKFVFPVILKIHLWAAFYFTCLLINSFQKLTPYTKHTIIQNRLWISGFLIHSTVVLRSRILFSFLLIALSLTSKTTYRWSVNSSMNKFNFTCNDVYGFKWTKVIINNKLYSRQNFHFETGRLCI